MSNSSFDKTLSAGVLPSLLEKYAKSFADDPDKIEEINSGLCADFADTFRVKVSQEGYNGTALDIEGIYDSEDAERHDFDDDVLLSAASLGAVGHTFLMFEDRFYDAEAPEGVDHPQDLPIFGRVKTELTS